MNRCCVVLDTDVDRLWRRWLAGPTDTAGNASDPDQTVIIDLNLPPSSRPGPHHHDPVNWRRWLLKQNIRQVHCYLPGSRTQLLLAAAKKQAQITLHLVEPLALDAITRLRLLQPGVKRFSCAGNFIARQLLKARFDPERITVNVPSVSVKKPPAARRRQIRRRIKNDKTGPLMLALSRPHNADALKPVIWAAALVSHALRDFTLAVTGPWEPADRWRLQRWREMMDVEGIVGLDRQTFDFDDLVGACDAVVVGPGPLGEVIRLLHVRAQRQHIVTGSPDTAEYLDGYDKVHYASSTAPRQLARAILELLDSKEHAKAHP